MSAGPEDDASKQMRRALYEVGALWQRVRNLKRDKADTGHDHDGRYVNEDGDTMSGDLDAANLRSLFSVAIANHGVSGQDLLFARRGTGSSRWVDLRVLNDDGTIGHLLRMRSGDDPGSPNLDTFTGSVEVGGDFDVSGAKNARIVDPDDATKGYRFAAVEADEPGLLIHRRTVTIPEGNGGEATVDLPPHWSRIARDGDAMVTPLNDTRDQAPAAAAVDLTVPEVTVRGKPGDYRVWVMAARADKGVDGWTHEVEVTPDDEGDDV